MNPPIYDMIVVGFGPANLSIAIAMDEYKADHGKRLTCCFVERQEKFEWHGGMLLPSTYLQVSFMKDLVTLRNPLSRYSFINYLHQKKRLESFINLRTFYPSRLEYNDYLSWAAETFSGQVHYGEDVTAVEPVEDKGKVEWLTVRSRRADGSSRERRARALVVGVGGHPNIPEVFQPHRAHPRLLHSSEYRNGLKHFEVSQPRIAVIGAGQSAAEIFRDALDRYPEARVDLISRSRALRPADDSPFVNEIFNPSFTDEIYDAPAEERRLFLRDFSTTNYAVVDPALIEEIYVRIYEDRVAGLRRLGWLPCRLVAGVDVVGGRFALLLRDIRSNREERVHYDVVILATGFHRQSHQELLHALQPWMISDTVERTYEVPMAASCRARVFLQGCCEETHGLADTLLSVLAIRSEEVVASLHAEGRVHREESVDLSPIRHIA